MTISFNSIPVGTRTPGTFVEFDSTRATNGLTPGINRILVVGQRLAAGTIDALTPKTVTSEGQADTWFGRGSMLSRMITALKAADRLVETIAVALDDAVGAVAATGTITIAGPSTASGTIALMIAGQRVAVTIGSGTSAADTATAIAAAVNTMPDLPVTASAAAAVVTLTARQKGSCGNEIDLRHSYYVGEELPAGITLAIVAMAGGAGDPDYGDVWSVIGDKAFSAIAIGTANAAILAACKTELESRFGPILAIDGFLFCAKSGSQGTLAAFGASLNSQFISVMGSGESPSAPWEWAASYAAVANAAANIDPARPIQTLELPGILAPNATELFTRAERELLLKDGISTFTADQDGTVRIERGITTYQVNAASAEDVSYLNVETMQTLSYLRYSLRNRFAIKFPRHKLADDGTRYGAGQKIVTPSVGRAELVALAREWEEAGLVEDLDQFIDELIVERNASDRDRLDALLPPNLVNQFRQFAAQVQFIL